MIRDHKIICKEYLAFIKSRSCLALGGHSHIGLIDPHHLSAQGWRQWKRNDFLTIPLCRKHHGEVEQIGLLKFEAEHKVNLWHEACLLIAEFIVEQRLIRIEN